jgi:hypothetical protein
MLCERFYLSGAEAAGALIKVGGLKPPPPPTCSFNSQTPQPLVLDAMPMSLLTNGQSFLQHGQCGKGEGERRGDGGEGRGGRIDMHT